MALFPLDFPNGPIVNTRTGDMSMGANGKYFFLGLFNRTGGAGGVESAGRTIADGLTVGIAGERRVRLTEPRRPSQGLTIGMFSAEKRARGT